jgi:hypothetical protein
VLPNAAGLADCTISHNVYYVRRRCARWPVPGTQAVQPAPALALPNGIFGVSPPTAPILRRSARLSYPDLVSVTAVLEPDNIGSILRARSAGTWPAPQQPGQNQAAHTRFNPIARDASRK